MWVRVPLRVLINNMERYIEELIEIYRKNTLKSDEELESLKSLLRNVHRDGFIAGE